MNEPTERERVRAILIAAGLSLPRPKPIGGQLTNAEREALAKRIRGKPLSQIIIEERGDRS